MNTMSNNDAIQYAHLRLEAARGQARAAKDAGQNSQYWEGALAAFADLISFLDDGINLMDFMKFVSNLDNDLEDYNPGELAEQRERKAQRKEDEKIREITQQARRLVQKS